MPDMLRISLVLWWLAAGGVFAATNAFPEKLAELRKPLEANPTNAVALFQLAQFCHSIGGDSEHPAHEEATKLAEQYFKQLTTLEPTNALAFAYLGSTLTMRARDTAWPFRQLSLVREGNQTQDRAVTLDTNSPPVRLKRAICSFHQPGFLGREQIARDDLAWLWKTITEKPDTLPVGDQQDVALFQGSSLLKQSQPDEARKVWEAGIEFAPQSPEARLIRKELEKLK
jgi:tetratricopeptide (TPR) repeat protein